MTEPLQQPKRRGRPPKNAPPRPIAIPDSFPSTMGTLPDGTRKQILIERPKLYVHRKQKKERFLEEVVVVPPEHTILNRENPDSLINKLPPALANILPDLCRLYSKVLAAPDDVSDVFYNPSEREERMKIQFWDEYNLACAQKRKMIIANIIRGVMFYETFYASFCKVSPKTAWLFVPPRDYALSMQAILNKGLARLHEIMNLPMKDPMGKPDHRTITQILRVFQIVDNRTKGSIIQRVQIQQQIEQNVTQHHGLLPSVMNPITNAEHAKAAITTMSLEEIEEMERKIERLERREKNRLGEARNLAGDNPFVAVELEKFNDRDGMDLSYVGELPQHSAMKDDKEINVDTFRLNTDAKVK